ncbi:MAG: hypothetical protein Q9M37_07775 [Desulfonauticus sp.]|nr:hypothetical protein [Desulfonauticus sp.]
MSGKKEKFDVIVVGLGPGGSVIGYLLALQGFKVLGIDYKQFPRFKLCGGLITLKTQKIINQIKPGALEELESKKIIFFSSPRYGIGFPDGVIYRNNLQACFKIVDRTSFDFYWYSCCKQSGAEVVVDKVVNVDVENNAVRLASGRKFFASCIIGADGVFSVVRKTLARQQFLKNYSEPGLAIALETFVSRLDFPYFPHIFFANIPEGYFWIFPHKQGYCVGVLSAKLTGQELKKYFFDFCRKKLNISPTRLFGAYLPYGNFTLNSGYKQCFLIGDAAGLADPLLGEGIFYAFKSAFILAKSFSCFPDFEQIRKRFYIEISQEVREFKAAFWWRKIFFTLSKLDNFKLFQWMFEKKSYFFEQIIQGERSFIWGKIKTRKSK